MMLNELFLSQKDTHHMISLIPCVRSSQILGKQNNGCERPSREKQGAGVLVLKGYSISAQEDEDVVEAVGGNGHPEQQHKPTLYPSTVFSITAKTANLSHIQSDVLNKKAQLHKTHMMAHPMFSARWRQSQKTVTLNSIVGFPILTSIYHG